VEVCDVADVKRRVEVMPELLSEQWFTEIENLAKLYANIPVPDQTRKTLINISAINGKESILLRLEGGQFKRGHSAAAKTTVTLPIREFMRIFIENDAKAGMDAFIKKHMKVEGDIVQLIELQWIEMNDEQRALQAAIVGLSELPAG
jgi:hypothetical protein